MDTKHTPGPWHVTGKHAECEVRYVGVDTSDRHSQQIATLYGFGGEQQEANARLIAAAPELLEAIQEIELVATEDTSVLPESPTWKAIEKARLALAKLEFSHCECPACAAGTIHASDCAVHNAPAEPRGPCDCGTLAQIQAH